MLPDAVYRVPPFDGDALALNFDENSSSLGAGSFNYIRMAHLNEAVADEGALLRSFRVCFGRRSRGLASGF
jgi:hypothetical protein